MISRTLVPKDVRPAKDGEAQKPPRRLSTYMDDRTVVPTELSDAAPLDGKTSIPAHMPLDVLVNRTLVPRGLPAKRIERAESVSDTLPLEVLGSRTVVPAHVEPLAPEEIEEFERAPEMTPELREIVEPDIFNTGDANLLMEPEDKRDPRADLVTRIASIAVHIAVIVFLISIPKLFPPHAPTDEEIKIAQRELTYLLPSEPKLPPAPPEPAVRINPKTLNNIVPPIAPPPPAPARNAPTPPSSLPEAPRPQAAPNQAEPPPSELEPIRPAQQNPKLNLQLPQSSPGTMLKDQMNEAIQHRGGDGSYMPPGGMPEGDELKKLAAGATILTPTEGVDFDAWLRRMTVTANRNLGYEMPDSVLLGQRGVTVVRFRVNRDGTMPPPYPILERTSGTESLDRACMACLTASNPFDPLPSAFKGPYIEIQGVCFFNIRPDQIK